MVVLWGFCGGFVGVLWGLCVGFLKFCDGFLKVSCWF